MSLEPHFRERGPSTRHRHLDEPHDDTFLYPVGFKKPDYGDLPETIPNAGLPWKLPAPVIEGQQINYRYYSNAGDQDCCATAVIFNGVLEWAKIERRDVPRRVVGIDQKISEYTHEMIKHHSRAREAWIAARATFHIGFAPRADEFHKVCAERKLTFQRKIFPHEDFREELWVNNKLDSSWHPRDGANWINY